VIGVTSASLASFGRWPYGCRAAAARGSLATGRGRGRPSLHCVITGLPGRRLRSAKTSGHVIQPAERTVVADLVRWLVEPTVSVVLVAACPVSQRHMAQAPAPLGGFPSRAAPTAAAGIFCGIPGANECPYGQCSGLLAKSGAGIRRS
jgi:hypothetical protein